MGVDLVWKSIIARSFTYEDVVMMYNDFRYLYNKVSSFCNYIKTKILYI